MAVVPYKDTVQRLLKNPMQKTFTFLGVTLIVVLVFLMGAIRPTVSTISSLRAEIRTRESVNEKMQAKINAIQELQSEYDSRKEDLSAIEVFFPVDADYSLLLASLERIAAKYGYELDNVQISIAESSVIRRSDYPDMESVDLRVSVSGRSTNLVEFISHLEELPVIPNIRRVGFTPEEGEDDTSWVRVSVDMYIYKTT